MFIMYYEFIIHFLNVVCIIRDWVRIWMCLIRCHLARLCIYCMHVRLIRQHFALV